MSSVLIKLQRKGQMVIPRTLRDQAGVAEGTLMKIAVIEGGQFLITPQVSIDRSLVSPAKSRKQALRELAATLDEIRQESKAKGIDKMSTREINSVVAAARRDRGAKAVKSPVK
jgi:bifunctional DNA-binding transcriptional regulator/antitoxin component of YhaV-PrlF toxin-antitoxin module